MAIPSPHVSNNLQSEEVSSVSSEEEEGLSSLMKHFEMKCLPSGAHSLSVSLSPPPLSSLVFIHVCPIHISVKREERMTRTKLRLFPFFSKKRCFFIPFGTQVSSSVFHNQSGRENKNIPLFLLSLLILLPMTTYKLPEPKPTGVCGSASISLWVGGECGLVSKPEGGSIRFQI